MDVAVRVLATRGRRRDLVEPLVPRAGREVEAREASLEQRDEPGITLDRHAVRFAPRQECV